MTAASSETLTPDKTLAVYGKSFNWARRFLGQKMGADVIGVVFIIELEGLGARELLGDIPIHSLLKYPA